ncbi:carbohydrate ABC transporter permease [Nocardia sp. XZ_19_385]|uniref:carbohydrate ABC transporter permease n=1 Tax=Nocardia sp. XZ_19_385 TaxID=2769488 RepID=UPI00188E3E2C|nr:carbohydrate ABC transporter permease [Nocardia sp. XZ_19_385]
MNRRRLGRAGVNSAAVAVILLSLFPVYWMVATALKPHGDIVSGEVDLIPDDLTFEHFAQIFSQGAGGTSIWVYLLNSVIVALGAVLIGSFFALFAATAVARFRFRGRTTFLILLIIIQMVPAEALLISLFLVVKDLGLYNQLAGLVVINVATTLPFAVWMLRTFVAAVPKELEEAAAIDGAGQFVIFVRILFPLVAPGLVATSIFSFINAWNEFIFAYTLISDHDKYTLPVSLTWFTTQKGVDWGPIMAMSTVMTIPVVLFFLLVQRRMVSGLTAGAIKG